MYQLVRVKEKSNSENIFVVLKCKFPKNGLQLKKDGNIYNVSFMCYNSFSVIKIPNDVTVNVGDVLVLSYYNDSNINQSFNLSNCTKNIVKEVNDGTSYYLSNQLELFPHGSWSLKHEISDPTLTLSPAVFGEYLFAKLSPEIKNTNYYLIDVYINKKIYKQNIKVFSNEQVGLNYYIFINNLIDNVYYTNIRLVNIQKKLIDNQQETGKISIDQNSDVSFLKYLSFYINQDIILELQGTKDLSLKVLPSDLNINAYPKELDTNNDGQNDIKEHYNNLVQYRKYLNTYDFLSLKNGIFTNTDIYDQIKSNITQNSFKSIDEYQSIHNGIYDHECFVWSDNGWYNYPNNDIYMIYTSKVRFSGDVTNIDTSTELRDISILIHMQSDVTGINYSVQNSFLVHYDFSNSKLHDVIKLSDGIYYYTNNKLNLIIDFSTGTTITQKYIDSTGVDYTDGIIDDVIYNVNESYKYAPLMYNGDVFLYNLPNYVDMLGININTKQPILFNYSTVSDIYNFNNKINVIYKPPYILPQKKITDIMHNNDRTEMYLKLNKYTFFYNSDANKMYDILDVNTAVNQNGSVFQINDDDMVRIKNEIYFNYHHVFNPNIISILNVSCEYNENIGEYDITMYYDVFGDSINVPSILNNNNIMGIIDTIKTNESILILMSLNDKKVKNTGFVKLPKNIVIKASYVGDILIIDFPEGYLNLNQNIVNKYYLYKHIVRLKTEFLDNVLYKIDIP